MSSNSDIDTGNMHSLLPKFTFMAESVPNTNALPKQALVFLSLLFLKQSCNGHHVQILSSTSSKLSPSPGARDNSP